MAVQNVDEYIAQFDGVVQQRLVRLREMIFAAVPDAEEIISYGMPAYKLNKNILLYFSGYKGHVGIYPGRVENYSFSSTLQKYASGKSTLKFPNDEPLPEAVISEFIRYRIEASKKGK